MLALKLKKKKKIMSNTSSCLESSRLWHLLSWRIENTDALVYWNPIRRKERETVIKRKNMKWCRKRKIKVEEIKKEKRKREIEIFFFNSKSDREIIFQWLFFLINRHHPNRLETIIFCLNSLILVIALRDSSVQHQVKYTIDSLLDSFTLLQIYHTAIPGFSML